jgi:HEAT repeats
MRPSLLKCSFIALVICCLATVFLCRSTEPTYKGRTVTQWLSAASGRGTTLFEAPDGAPPSEFIKCRAAIRAIGTNSIPILLKYVEAQDTTFVAQIESLLTRQSLLPVHPATAKEKRVWALYGFRFLGKDAVSAVPALGKLAQHPNPDVRHSAYYCLSCIDPEKQTYLPILTQLLHDQDPSIRLDAARTISDSFSTEAENLGVFKEFPLLRARSITPPFSSSDATNSKVKK